MVAMSSHIEVPITEAVARRAAGATWLDVREPEEWASARIADTHLRPLAGAIAAIVSEHPALDTALNISCASGVRSMRVTEALRSMGYTDVVNVAGGIKAWVAEGRPVETGHRW